MCVGLGEPTRAVFFKQTGGLPGRCCRWTSLFDDAAGTTQAQTIGMLGVAQQWRLSPQLLTMANLLPTIGAGKHRDRVPVHRDRRLVPGRRPVRRSLAQALNQDLCGTGTDGRPSGRPSLFMPSPGPAA